MLFLISFVGYAQSPCDFTLELNDTYGDGWNGNTMDVLVNGIPVLDDVTLASGSSTTMTFTVNDGDEITTVWNGGGSWVTETSYIIYHPVGPTIVGEAEDGDEITTPIVVDCANPPAGPTPPANDECGTATVIACGGSSSGSTENASVSNPGYCDY